MSRTKSLSQNSLESCIGDRNVKKKLYPQVSIDSGIYKLTYMQHFSNIIKILSHKKIKNTHSTLKIVVDAVGTSQGSPFTWLVHPSPTCCVCCAPFFGELPSHTLNYPPPHPSPKVAHSQRLAWVSQGAG